MQIKLKNGDSIYLRNFVKVPNRLLISICEPTDREKFTYKLKESDISKLSRKAIRLLMVLLMTKEDFSESYEEYEDNLGELTCINARVIAEILKCEKREVLKALNELQSAGIISFMEHIRANNIYTVQFDAKWLTGSTSNYTELDAESLSIILSFKTSEYKKFGKNEIKLYLRFMMDNAQDKKTMRVRDIKHRVSRQLNYKSKITRSTEKLEPLFKISYHQKEFTYKRKSSVRDKKNSYKAEARKKISNLLNDIAEFPASLIDTTEYKKMRENTISRLANVSLITGVHNIIQAIKLTYQEYEQKCSKEELLKQLPALAATISYSLFNRAMLPL